LYNLPVYMDRSLTNNEVVVFPAGTHTESMSVRLADYARLVEPAIVEFARSKITFVP
jgi:Ala-tRNA(Pro) deacylase